MASEIPGVKLMAELVNYDKGLKDAIENEFVQIINQSNTKDGVTLTVDHLLIDKQRLIVFSSIETDKMFDEIGFESIQLRDKKGEIIENYGVSYGYFTMEDHKGSAMLDFTWKEDQEFTDEMSIKVELVQYKHDDSTKDEPIAEPLTVTFPVDF